MCENTILTHMAKNYRQVSLAEPLYRQVKHYVDGHPQYTSVADSLKELFRKELERLESAPRRLPKEEKEGGDCLWLILLKHRLTTEAGSA